MDPKTKAELKRAYKETPTRKGIFKIYSAASGQTWVDSSINVDTIKNRIWFMLRMGSHPNKKLQQAWNESGEDAIHFEVAEVFKDDASQYELDDLMKERKQHWIEALGAEAYQ